jgi:hypothetical protein
MISSIATPTRMPSGIRKSGILGPNGKPVSYFLYPSPRHNLRQYKPRFFLSADTKVNVSEYDRWELVNYSRQLRAQVDVLSTAIEEKNSWAFGDAWDPHYCGKNKKWGQEAEEFLRLQFYPMCNVRGPQYDLKRSLEITGQMLDVDGDDAMVLTQTESGFPQIAFFPSTRVGVTSTGGRSAEVSGVVSGGRFDGAKIFDGVIYDKNMRMIGLRISGEDGQTTDISSYSADLTYEAVWHDQGRGIPRVAVSLLRWMNLQDIDEFLQRGMKRAAAVGLKFKRETGEAGTGNEVITSEEDASSANGANGTVVSGEAHPQVYYEEIEGGEMYYLNSTTGEDIEALDFKNPHPNSEKFIERIQRGSLLSVGWSYELMNLNSTGRSPSYIACALANKSIGKRQATVARRWRRIITYAVAKGMKEGFISRNDDGLDPYLWEPGLPAEITPDTGNVDQADRENLKMGTTSKTIITQKRGYHRREIDAHRQAEVMDLIETTREIKATAPEVPFEKIMDLLEQRSPNGTPPPPQAKAAAPKGNQ